MEFDRVYAQRCQVDHVVVVSSCSTPLYLAPLAVGIGEGDEVLLPALTWVSTANAGTPYKSVPAEGLEIIGCFSYHPRKSVTTGEGGVITTQYIDVAEKFSHETSISEEARHLGPGPFILSSFDVMGYIYHMTDIQATIGTVQLGKLDRFIDDRQHLAKFYYKEFCKVEWLRTPLAGPECRHDWQFFVCFVDENKAPKPRIKIMEMLFDRGSYARPGTHVEHLLEYYLQKDGFCPNDYSGAKAANDFSISNTLHNQMSYLDFEYVVERIKEFT